MKRSYRTLLISALLMACISWSFTDARCETAGARALSSRIGTAELPGLPIDDIGISAYANIGQLNTTDLTRVTSGFASGSIDQGTDYASGTMTISNGYNGSATVGVYVNLSGWMIAYLEKSLTISRIVLWRDETGYNALEEAIKLTLENLPAIAFSTVQKDILYYDFEYPEANSIMMIKDWADDGGTKISGSYTITIPTGVLLYDLAFSLVFSNTSGTNGQSELYFNNNLVLFTNPAYRTSISYYQSISADQLQPDTPYLVKTADYNGGITRSAAVLIYKK